MAGIDSNAQTIAKNARKAGRDVAKNPSTDGGDVIEARKKFKGNPQAENAFDEGFRDGNKERHDS